MKTLFIVPFFLCALSEVSFGHDADTAKPFEKIHAHRTFTAHACRMGEPLFFEGRDALDENLLNSSLELGYDHISGSLVRKVIQSSI